QWLIDALRDALKSLDQAVVKQQITQYMPDDVQPLLAAAGLRDEYLFPIPVVLEAKPSLVGYYRMLLGAPQKTFYKGATGMGLFKSMEEFGTLSKKQKAGLPAFCEAMAEVLAALLREIGDITDRDVRELPLLTFGAQLQGSNNTAIGKKAMADVFMAVTEIVKKHIIKEEQRKLTIKNASGRTVIIALSSDPDVSIVEMIGATEHLKVAIEVKGGTDVSNVHNRAGEAEKSHLKAKLKGYRDFWTIISKKGISLAKLQRESQTTTIWFDAVEVLGRRGTDWNEFREHLAGAIGIPLIISF
ncbi:MAG TPA: XcyI family restriction endonuclease, partial [Syntrophobacteraceae bacterium]|nr:XcyI family restriction endonuclease [Syntrophobacteraceae bacterium]